MNKMEFSPEVIKKLKYYVYKLIDPRNGQVFYVGKGKGNRIFEHVNCWNGYVDEEIIGLKDEEIRDIKKNRKMAIISNIKSVGLEVIYVIHRHGMDEKTAFEVEAALIDAYPGLSNVQGGIGSNDYGPMSCEQIVKLYDCPVINNFKEDDKLALIKIRQISIDWNDGNVYETVRKWWKIGERRNEVKQVAAVLDGIIIKVFQVTPNSWLKAEDSNRYSFEGIEIKESPYLNKRIPDEYRKKGAASPVLYTFDTYKEFDNNIINEEIPIELRNYPVIDSDFDKEDKVLLIKIRQDSITYNNGSIYETVRKWWKIGEKRNEVKQVVAVVNGVVKGAYEVIPNSWLKAEDSNRYSFEGLEIEDSPYINKIIPEKYRKQGSANPVQYTF